MKREIHKGQTWRHRSTGKTVRVATEPRSQMSNEYVRTVPLNVGRTSELRMSTLRERYELIEGLSLSDYAAHCREVCDRDRLRHVVEAAEWQRREPCQYVLGASSCLDVELTDDDPLCPRCSVVAALDRVVSAGGTDDR